MNKLPAPIAPHYAAPLARALPYAQGTQEAARLARGGLAEIRDGEPRRTFGQRAPRRPPEIELERPLRGAERFAAANSAPPRDVSPAPQGPSAAFLAQLIGQAVPDFGAPGGTSRAGGLAHSAYRQAGGKPPSVSGQQVSLAV